ncbi:hypothetical protein [Candidatus Manganitrophus noduliformans]|uniref:Uncharacterized protein n=1 Tax=Candidatus Manganitrophus noduliformans TaxID=2606439 RepID=A0A7X6I9R3_9BACT|nr:hypothetical protein [Candidatus Manganitrophus noduliformans]NKE69640.1 hypothetical protein [Candidatus Manganitrophus noduliformans]
MSTQQEKGQQKEMLRLVTALRELLPDLLLTFGAVERLHPPPDLLARIAALRTKLEGVAEEARRLEEAADCMPAAERGRQQRL